MMVLPECSFVGCRVEREALFKSPYSEKGRPAIYLGWGGGNWAVSSCPFRILPCAGEACWVLYGVPSLLRQVRVWSAEDEVRPKGDLLSSQGEGPSAGAFWTPQQGGPGSTCSPRPRASMARRAAKLQRWANGLGSLPGTRAHAAGGRGPPRADGCRECLDHSPISRLKAAVRASVAKRRPRWGGGQAGRPATGGGGPVSLPPPVREWRPAQEARPAACSPASPGGWGWVAAGRGQGATGQWGEGIHSTAEFPLERGRGGGGGRGESSKVVSDGRPWWGPEPPRDSLGRRVRTEAEEDAGRGRLRQERHAPPWPPLPSRAPLGHPPACAGSIAPPAGRRPHAWRAKAEALTGCDRLGLPGLGAAGGE